MIQHEKQKKVIQVTEEEYEIYTSMGSTFQQCKVGVCVTSSVGVYFVAAGREVTSSVPLFVEKFYQRVFVSQFVLVCV